MATHVSLSLPLVSPNCFVYHTNEGDSAVMPTSGADVIVDFDFEDGFLYLGIHNIGTEPALTVQVEFSPSFRCLGGEVPVQSIALFRSLAFLSPGKKIRTLVDSAAAWFGRGEPSRVKAHISWSTRDGAPRKAAIEHNLEIYRNLAYLPARNKEE